MNVQLAPLELRPVVEEVGRQLLLLAGAAGLVARVGPIDDAVVNGDADGLKQLLLILIDNAVTYTPPPGTVQLRLERCGDGVAIDVIDSGIGIDAAEHERVFERFYRADPARTGGGAGLGLAIARWLVEAHNGRIEVQSAPGCGSTFRVTLPVVDASTGL
jgi:signal transduction histidine kinase